MPGDAVPTESVPNRQRIPAVLSIAGSDSGGGAGIQADLKAFAACGVHGMTAITAITAQNTVGLTRVEPVSPEMIIEQVRAVVSDIGVDAIKIGMLSDVATVEAVVAALALAPGIPVVLDPVMVSESGAGLLSSPARQLMIERALPLATVVTPNIPEARELSGLGEAATQRELAVAIRLLGPDNVVVTGGHSEDLTDLFFDGIQSTEIPGDRRPGGSAHGSGCTHSSVLAARLALGDTPLVAAIAARRIAGDAVGRGLAGIGRGPGPVDVIGLEPDAAA